MMAPRPHPHGDPARPAHRTDTLDGVSELRANEPDAGEEDTPQPATVDADYIVFFDGICVLCHTGMKQLQALDTEGKLHYAQLQGETAEAFGIEWDESASAGSQTFAFVDNTGPEPVVHQRMRAVRAELEAIDRLPVLQFLLRVVPLPISDLVYRLIAATRYRIFGTYDECPIPPPDVRARFLP